MTGRNSSIFRTNVPPPLWILLVVSVGLVISFDGWRGTYNPFSVDQLANRQNARAIVDSGRLPVTSGLSSLGAYNPPGSSWYFVPSVFFEDPNLGERLSSFLLYLLTVVPVFLVGQRVGGRRVAFLLALLYTLSAVGIFFAQNLQPRARPFSYAWLLFFLLGWLETGGSRYLFGALVSLGIGMLIFLEMAPIIVGMAAAYWKYKPKIRPTPVLASIAVVLVLWWPYLDFQFDRHFVDLRASVTQTDIGPDKFSTLRTYGDSLGTWATPTRLGPFTPPKTGTDERPEVGFWKSTVLKAYWAGPIFTGNFRLQHYLGVIPVTATLLFILLAANHLYGPPGPTKRSPFLILLSTSLVICAIIANEATVSMIIARELSGAERWLVRVLQAGLVLLSLALVARRPLSRLAARLTTQLGFGGSRRPFPDQLEMIAYVVVPTWLTFSFTAGAVRYTMGFWVLQWTLVGLILLYCPRYYRFSGWVRSAALVLAFLLVVPNRTLINNLKSWQEHGYPGRKHGALHAADEIARLSKSANLETPRVGYFLSFNGTELTFALIDERYGGIGHPISQYLEIRHGISPPQQPPEGFSNRDDFRLVQLSQHHDYKYHRFFLTEPEAFQPLGRWGDIELLARSTG